MKTYRNSMINRFMTTKIKTGIIASNINAAVSIAMKNISCIAPIIPQVVRS